MTKLSKKFEQRIRLSKQCYDDYAIFGYKQLYEHLEEIKKLEKALDNLMSSSRIMQESDSERLLEAFIKEIKREFPDTNFDYLRCIKDRVLASSGASSQPIIDRFLVRSKLCGTLVSDQRLSKIQAESVVDYFNNEAKINGDTEVLFETVNENDL